MIKDSPLCVLFFCPIYNPFPSEIPTAISTFLDFVQVSLSRRRILLIEVVFFFNIYFEFYVLENWFAPSGVCCWLATHTYTHMCMCVCVCIYIYIYIYIYLFIYLFIYTRRVYIVALYEIAKQGFGKFMFLWGSRPVFVLTWKGNGRHRSVGFDVHGLTMQSSSSCSYSHHHVCLLFFLYLTYF